MAIAVPRSEIFEEVLDFLASAPSQEAIIAYRVPASLDDRLHHLLDKNNTTRLTAEEQDELEEFLRMNRLLMRLKARARGKKSA